jgi:hypothetical protein
MGEAAAHLMDQFFPRRPVRYGWILYPQDGLDLAQVCRIARSASTNSGASGSFSRSVGQPFACATDRTRPMR